MTKTGWQQKVLKHAGTFFDGRFGPIVSNANFFWFLQSPTKRFGDEILMSNEHTVRMATSSVRGGIEQDFFSGRSRSHRSVVHRPCVEDIAIYKVLPIVFYPTHTVLAARCTAAMEDGCVEEI